MKHTGQAGDLASRGTGIARYTFPDGEPLDRVETEVLLSGPPCWFPGTMARVLFAATDGSLYRMSFEQPSGGSIAAEGRVPAPVALHWEVEGISEEDVFLADPIWPAGPQFRDTILVSLRQRELLEEGPLRRYCHSEVWWLRLDPSRSRIIAGGRVTRNGPGNPGETLASEFCPTVAIAPNGETLLGYLALTETEAQAQLMVASMEFDESEGTPTSAAPWVVAEKCFLITPVFSSGGRTITCLIKREDVIEQAIVVEFHIGVDDSMLASRRRESLVTQPSS